MYNVRQICITRACFLFCFVHLFVFVFCFCLFVCFLLLLLLFLILNQMGDIFEQMTIQCSIINAVIYSGVTGPLQMRGMDANGMKPFDSGAQRVFKLENLYPAVCVSLFRDGRGVQAPLPKSFCNKNKF